MAKSPYPSAAEAQKYLRRLEFSDKRRQKGLEPPVGAIQLFFMINHVGWHAEGAKIAGDLVTHDALREWIRRQRSVARTGWNLRDSEQD